MKIVLMEPLGVSDEIIEKLADSLRAAGHTFASYDTFTTDTDELIRRADDADVLMIANHPLPGEVIRADKNLKFISVAFVGIDHIDTDACREMGVAISNTGGYCDDAVAELAVGLALSCLRNIPECNAAVQSGGGKGSLAGNELAGRTVGIIGTGAIGMCAAWLAKYLGAGRVVMVGRNDKKLETARLIGADEVINNVKESMTERLMELSDGKGIRQIVETTGAPEVLRESLKCIASRGRVSVAGFFEQDIDGIPMDRIVLKHQSLVGAAGCLGNAEKVCRIMQETPVSLLPLVTHKIPFEQCAYVFEHFSDYAREKIKIMVEFQ